MTKRVRCVFTLLAAALVFANALCFAQCLAQDNGVRKPPCHSSGHSSGHDAACPLQHELNASNDVAGNPLAFLTTAFFVQPEQPCTRSSDVAEGIGAGPAPTLAYLQLRI